MIRQSQSFGVWSVKSSRFCFVGVTFFFLIRMEGWLNSHFHTTSKSARVKAEPLGWSIKREDGFWGEAITTFHDTFLSSILLSIILGTVWVYQALYTITERRFNFTHHFGVEFIWTLLPTIILILIGAPSLAILYGMEDSSVYAKRSYSCKRTGFQWFWVYEYNLTEGEEVESYMDDREDEDRQTLMGREADFQVPASTNIRNIIGAGDVIHRWAIPSLCLKVDAIPGRLNTLNFRIESEGEKMFGQCSELCGVNHRFIPIILRTRTNL